jgi:hypothetical protein
MLAELTPTKPHCDERRPYGYRFEAIELYKMTDFSEAMEVFGDVDDDYNQHDIQLGNNFPHVDRVIWEVASHIEGNFGPPYDAILVYSEAHNGTLYIFTPKSHHWWNNDIRSMLSNYLMGLRSLLDLLR